MKKIVCGNYEEISRLGAFILSDRILRDPGCTLGLATGSTPIGVYKNLVEMHKAGELDFSGVTTFNLDEYYPIQKSNPQSYDYFMWENLFSHINIKRENVHLPNGEAKDPEAECAAYEKMIAGAGGLDLQLLGIGNNGHIGFNEPASELKLHTHLTSLTPNTIDTNARFFTSRSEVPTQALTMGMGTIMRAKSILLLISGEGKAPAAKRLFSGVITTEVPASALNLHPDVTVLLDRAAASLL